MHCSEMRELLPLHLYGDLPPEQAAGVDKHVAECPACRRDRDALQAARRILDAVPGPAVHVDLSRIYARSSRLQQRRLRRWQFAAAAFAVAAATLFVAFAFKLEVHAEAHQVTVRWSAPPDVPSPPALPPATP